MGIQLEMLEAEALKLTLSKRAAFAQFLLESLDEDVANVERFRSFRSQKLLLKSVHN